MIIINRVISEIKIATALRLTHSWHALAQKSLQTSDTLLIEHMEVVVDGDLADSVIAL